jgi:alpha-beta hydrolase superfamily lysophospholipase
MTDSYHNRNIDVTRLFPQAEEFKFGYFPDRNGIQIFYRGWKKKNTQIPSCPKVMLVIHGMVAHSEPYIPLADVVVDGELIVYAIDLIGHGYSEGMRGDYSSYRLFLENIEDALVFLLHNHPDSDFYLCGESMGGLLAILYLIILYPKSAPVAIKKALFWAPALAPSKAQITFRSILKGLKIGFFLLLAPAQPLFLTEHRDCFQVKEIENYDAEDPKNLAKYSVRYLLNIKKGLDYVKRVKGWQLLTIPFCIIVGEKDIVVDPQASQTFFENSLVKSRSEFISVPNSWHCVYKDPNFTPEFQSKVREFLKRENLERQ